MDIYKELVAVRNALGNLVTLLDPLEDSAAVLGMDSLASELSEAGRQLAGQRRALHAIINAIVAEKFNEAQATSANVLHAALAGAEIATQIESQRQTIADQFAEREMRDAMADWRQRSAETGDSN